MTITTEGNVEGNVADLPIYSQMSQSLPIQVELIASASDRNIPKYAHEGDAGMDLRSNVRARINPGAIAKIATGIKVAIPSGYVGLIHPRSGLASKGITVANAPGTIDSGYRGELMVLLVNHGELAFDIHDGDRIAQLVVQKFEHCSVKVVESLDHQTERGDEGFGSSGIK